jgi:5-formyltetrahydrofolate cyclo-ligase
VALRDRVLGLPEIAAAEVVAAYVSVGAEPDTSRLLESWQQAGVTVLLPVLLPDSDLDWVRYTGTHTLRRASRGLLEPEGPRLGVSAVRRADALVVPAVAVDARGQRLGRGGGSYDRALARADTDQFSLALLYDAEILPEVPAGPHDRPVHAAVTPARVLRLR